MLNMPSVVIRCDRRPGPRGGAIAVIADMLERELVTTTGRCWCQASDQDVAHKPVYFAVVFDSSSLTEDFVCLYNGEGEIVQLALLRTAIRMCIYDYDWHDSHVFLTAVVYLISDTLLKTETPDFCL
jgi:hypothetical protein